MNEINTDSGQAATTYQNAGRIFKGFFEEIGKVIVGQNKVIEQIVIAILCEGHALVESNPGLGKTLMISTVSKAMNLKFSRIQCTPDLMPSDITGTNIIEEKATKKDSGSDQDRFSQMSSLQTRLTGHPLTPVSPLEAMQEQAGNRRKRYLPSGPSIFHPCHPEPHRNGGHIPPA